MDLMLIIVLFILSFLTIILSQKYFLSNNYIDKINNRSSHQKIATRSGGLSLFVSFFFISTIAYINGIELFDYSLIIPLMMICAVGIYDDVYDLDFKLKFIFQLIFAKIIIDNGLIIDNLHGFLGVYEMGRIISQIFTVFIIVAIVNAINFIDGVDGLALSVFIMFISLFELFSLGTSQFSKLSVIIICLALPLYYFNFRDNFKIFLGDSGSYFLGGLVSIYVLYICSNVYVIKPQYDLNKIVFVFSLLSYPIIDMIRVFIIRLKNGKSPFVADKNHIHHILLKNLKSHFKVTITIMGFSLLITLLCQLTLLF